MKDLSMKDVLRKWAKTPKYKPTKEELIRDTKRAGFCTGDCGSVKEPPDCKKCKEDYINK